MFFSWSEQKEKIIGTISISHAWNEYEWKEKIDVENGRRACIHSFKLSEAMMRATTTFLSCQKDYSSFSTYYFFLRWFVGKVVGGFFLEEVDHHNKWRCIYVFSV